ncbi:heme exporter protein CcmD [Sphingomicrobium arenosum]|nr:heme exporter protein CcmD [Sphingomicrobium arenosum]
MYFSAYVIAAYGIGIAAMAILTVQSWRAMRRAEDAADKERRR